MLTAHDVASGYRLILGREPENSSVVEHHVASSTIASFRDALLSSREFQERLKSDASLQQALTPAVAVMNALRPQAPPRPPVRAGRFRTATPPANQPKSTGGFFARLRPSRVKEPSK